MLALPAGLSPRVAALTEPTAVALHAVTLSGVRPDDRVLVTGAGPVGLLVTAVLAAQGVRDITVSEPAAAASGTSPPGGCGARGDPDALPVPTMGSPVPEPFTVAFECSGHGVAAEQALDQLDFAGVCVLVGTGAELPRVNHNRVIVLEVTIMGSYNYDAAGFAPALELLASGRLPVDELVEPVDVFLDELLPVMRRSASGELAGKVMVRPEVSEEARG